MSRSLAFVLSIGLLTAMSQAQRPREIPFDDIARPKQGEWPSYHGRLSANRHSPLDHINTRNVATLEPKWIHEMGGTRALQMTPLVVDGVMYAAAVNEVRALDASTGRRFQFDGFGERGRFNILERRGRFEDVQVGDRFE
jgi:glucose dehydrogenase